MKRKANFFWTHQKSDTLNSACHMIGLRSYKIFYTENKKYINNQTQLQVCRKGYNSRPKMVRNNFRNKISGNQWYSLTCTEEGPIWWSHGLIHTLHQNMIFLRALGSWHMCVVNQICGFRHSNVNKKNMLLSLYWH